MVEPEEIADIVRAISADQHRQWTSGRRFLVEGYLVKNPRLAADREALLDVIYNEVRLRTLSGDEAKVQEYHHRFPHLSDDLEPLFQVHGALDSVLPEATYSVGDIAARPSILRSINWPGSARPIAIVDDAFERHVMQCRQAGQEGQRVGASFYYHDELRTGELEGGPLLLRELPGDALAVVYQAFDAARARTAAVKILLNGPYLCTAVWEAVKDRIAKLSGIRHPHLAAIYEAGELAGLPYVSMEFAECASLAEHLRMGRLPPQTAIRLAQQISAGLLDLRRYGLMHSNLKPSNALLSIEGAWKLSDMSWSAILPDALNLGMIVERPQEKKSVQTLIRELAGVARPPPHLAIVATSGGWRMGDARYLPPDVMAENYEGPTPADDIYALGAILFESLTGRPPFCGATPAETLRLAAERPVPEDAFNYPFPAAELCLRCLAKRPAERPEIEECAAILNSLPEE